MIDITRLVVMTCVLGIALGASVVGALALSVWVLAARSTEGVRGTAKRRLSPEGPRDLPGRGSSPFSPSTLWHPVEAMAALRITLTAAARQPR